MPLNPIPDTITAIRAALRELDLLPDSDHLLHLKQLLRKRIAELEHFAATANAGFDQRA